MTVFNGAFNAKATARATFTGHRVVSGFPRHALGVKVELLLNTTWTDITHYVLVRDDISISPFGRTDETSSMNSASMTLTLKNTDGRFTPDNTSGAYYPYVQLNTQIRVYVNDGSVTGVTYSGYRFWGEVSEWPPQWDPTAKDVYCTITASGIWRRLSQRTKTLGSPYTRFNNSLASSFNLVGYWPMEDGQGSSYFATTAGATSGNMTVSGPPTNVPSLASVSGFKGSNALPTLNAAELDATVSTSSNPTTNQLRFCLFVPSGGDTGRAAGTIARMHTSGTVATVDVKLGANGTGPLQIVGLNSSGGTLFSSSSNLTTWGVPMLVAVSLAQVGGNIVWAMNTILPGGTTWNTTTTNSISGTVNDATSVIFNPGGVFNATSVGQASLYYGNPGILITAQALNGWGGENALTRFTRLCGEEGIPADTIGSSATPMGYQVDDTLLNVLQEIEDTDGGLIYETRNQFGLGYRTMASLQNQASALTLDYSQKQVGQPLTPVNDDAMVRNDITLTSDYDGYSVRVYLANGARSLNNPPNGVGSGYEYSRNVNSTSHTQVNNLGIQLLNNGTFATSRYPVITANLARTTTAPLFSSIPSLRGGDFFTITNMPAVGGGATQKQLVWGWTETINNYTWTIAFNTSPEDPWESSFNPGTSFTGQVPASPTVQGGAGGAGTVTSAQIAEGAIIGQNLAAGAVQGGNIAVGTITATNIADATITATQIGLGAINGTNIANATILGTNIASGTITGTNLASATITGTNIASGTITGTQIAAATITGSNIGSATIAGSNLVNNTITATQIANATISSTQISATAGITGSQLANGTITATQIAAATITSSQIANGTITGSDIAGGTITATNIQSATITNTQIAGGSITGSNIANSTITGANLVNATITNVQIANGTITTTQITNGTITGTDIASGTVAGSNIAAGTITASNIAAGTITSSLIAANTITAGDIQAGIVLAGAVDGTTVTGAQIVADGAGGQVLIYNGTPGGGNLVGSWSGTDGTDGFGNSYVAGLAVNQGLITGIGIDSVTITNATLQGDVLSGSTITEPAINGGTMTETDVVFDSTGGNLLVYTSSTTSATFTPADNDGTSGKMPFVVPSGVTTLQVECWGGGAGGDGGSTSVGGNGGGGGEYAAELNYPVTPAESITFFVGSGGVGNSTGNGHGTGGGDTSFDSTAGVRANGGNGDGTPGTGSANTIHHDGGSGPSSGANAGGSSGGNSGNINNAGNNGIAATSSTGAAAPSTQTGSGRGGAGGNNGANGGNGGTPGAGGGGAGKGTVSSSKAISYAPVWTGSYYGPDANASVNDTLRSTSTMYQGGETAGGGAFNGNQRCVFGFNRTQMASDFSGYTITACEIQLKNLHSWYNSGMTFTLDEYQGLPGSVPGTYPAGDYLSTDASGTIAEGATHAYSLSASIAQRFVTGSSNGLGLGATLHTIHPYNLNYYGYFDPSQIRFKIYGTITGAGNQSGGNGADGQVKITYTSGQVLAAAISPAAGTDVFGNSYVAGGSFQNVQLFGANTPAAPPGGTSVLYGTTAGTPSYILDSGLKGQIPATQTDVGTTYTATTTGTNITLAYSIPANDANVGTVYRLTAWGFGTWASGNIFWECNGLGTINSAAEFSSLPASFFWRATSEIIILTTGSSGTAWFGTECAISTVSGGTAAPNVAAGLSGGAPTPAAQTVNTTTAHAMAITIAANTSPSFNIKSYWSTFERIGP